MKVQNALFIFLAINILTLCAFAAEQTTPKDIQILFNKNNKSLLNAAKNSDLDKAKELLKEKHININTINESGHTPLILAAKHCPEIAKMLLPLGANPNIQTNRGYTALMYAMLDSNPELVKTLCEFGADVNITNNEGDTALCLALKNVIKPSKRIKIVKILLQFHADPNKSKPGKAPLLIELSHYYAESEIIKALIDAGANVNAQNKDGYTPLIYSVQEGKESAIMQMLLNAGANLNIQNNYGETALFEAVECHNLNKVKILLNAGANPNISTFKNITPLDSAKEYQPWWTSEVWQNSESEIVKMLLTAGAKSSTNYNNIEDIN